MNTPLLVVKTYPVFQETLAELQELQNSLGMGFLSKADSKCTVKYFIDL